MRLWNRILNPSLIAKGGVCAFVIVAGFLGGRLVARTGEHESNPIAARSDRPDGSLSQGTVQTTVRGKSLRGTVVRRGENPFAVPRSTLGDLQFERFDEEMRVTEEARAILQISDAEAQRLREVVLDLVPEYRASQTRRIRKANHSEYPHKGGYQIASASEDEVEEKRHAFIEAAAAIVGKEKARQLRFPIEINGPGVLQCFQVIGPGADGVIKITALEIRDDEKGISHIETDHVAIQPDEPLPERWQHLLVLEDTDIETGGRHSR